MNSEHAATFFIMILLLALGFIFLVTPSHAYEALPSNLSTSYLTLNSHSPLTFTFTSRTALHLRYTVAPLMMKGTKMYFPDPDGITEIKYEYIRPYEFAWIHLDIYKDGVLIDRVDHHHFALRKNPFEYFYYSQGRYLVNVTGMYSSIQFNRGL